MASSSASSMHRCYRYDVFLSFRGEDTRKNFVDHLYYALRQQNINAYKDDVRLEKGKKINDELLKSIEESKFCIIVFSKNYASSSWCLDELVKITECQKTTEQIAYPVFYDVDPSEVHKQSGTFGEAFAKHNREEVGKWREAFEEAANLAGWDLRNTADGHEAKVIKIIVEKISLELRSINLGIDENLVGMEPRMHEVESSLEIGLEDVRMVGIKGIGGGGKTTLARAVFDKLYVHFEGASFVENVKEISKASGLPSLQKQILSDVLNEQSITIRGAHDGKRAMKTKLCGKKVLLVLDDVDDISQLEALAGAPNWFKPGSRIIITTRDEQLLVAHRVKCIHNVNLLSDEEAIRLFGTYAFGSDTLIPRFGEHSQKVVHYAAGLPLTIKVLGSFLCGKDDLEWTDALNRLDTIPLKQTLEILELSYIDLEDDYKEIFLDVACFLKGFLKSDAIRILESCEFHARSGLRVLEQKSLVTISDQRLGMHDHIQELGRNIVRRSFPDEPNRHSRLWISNEVQDILANDLGTEATKAITVDGWLKLDPEIVTKGFGNMKKLRFLHVRKENIGSFRNDPFFFGDVEIDQVSKNFPNALRFLKWDCYPRHSLPRSFQANNLVALEMRSSRIVQLWKGGEDKVLNKLKFLDLRRSLLVILNLGMTPNLEKLNLKECSYLVKLCVPFGGLKKLTYLNLSKCLNFKSFSVIKELESLEILCLTDLHMKEFPNIIPGHSKNSLLQLRFSYNDIEELPSSIENFQKLVDLDLHTCTKLKSLPESICGLRHLRTLQLYACNIEEVPSDLGDLECLENLNLSTTKIKHLPNSICMLKHLKTLILSYCRNLEKLPKDLGQLQHLENLILSECTKIRDIPESICGLRHLRMLQLDFCNIEEVPKDLCQLECLENLNLLCTQIKHLPDSICMLKHLKILILSYCRKLEKLPEDLGQLQHLEDLILRGCKKIRGIPESICKLKHLMCLNVSFCHSLEKLPEELGHLECLQELNVAHSSIRHLPQSISFLKGLKIDGSESVLLSSGFASSSRTLETSS